MLVIISWQSKQKQHFSNFSFTHAPDHVGDHFLAAKQTYHFSNFRHIAGPWLVSFIAITFPHPHYNPRT
jgi:hypothetical protein